MAEFQVYQESSGHYRWKLVANNGQWVATSHLDFLSPEECVKSVDFVKRFASFANIQLVDQDPHWADRPMT